MAPKEQTLIQRWLGKPTAARYELLAWLIYSLRELFIIPFAFNEFSTFSRNNLFVFLLNLLSSNLFTLILPFACYFVLGTPPLLLFVRKFSDLGREGATGVNVNNDSTLNESAISSRPDGYSQLLTDLGRSKKLADDTLRRTNTHLLLGLFTATAGVAVFYMLSQKAPISFPNPVSWESVLAYVFASLPRVAVLIFIEVTAGFFLKQYRFAMNDFKHFEQLQRRREDVLLSYHLRLKHGGSVKELAENLTESSPTLGDTESESINDHAQIIIELAKVLGGRIGKNSPKSDKSD